MSNRAIKTLVVQHCLASAGIIVAMLYSRSAEYYPPYSSLRVDERGTTILYESLEQSGAYRVTRSFLPLDQLHAANVDILLIGVWPVALEARSEPLWSSFENLASHGNRVLVGLSDSVFDVKDTSVLTRHGVSFQWVPVSSSQDKHRRFRISNAWQVLRQDESGIEAIERRYGSGSLILLAESDLFLNRTLAKAPDSAFVLSLLGSKPEAIFNESHLGVVETGSVIGLARRYHLHGLIWGLLLLGGFFLWRNIPSFPPRLPELTGDAVSWEDSFVAFRRLLRKSLASADLLNYCIEARMQMEKKQAKRQALESAFAESAFEKDIVRRFQFLQSSLNRGRDSK